jgi:plastocyanin
MFESVQLEEVQMRSSFISALAMAFAGALMISCGSGGSTGGGTTTPTAPTGPNVVVNIGSGLNTNSFNPNPVPASVGQTVAFKNNDKETHHIVLDNGSQDFGDIAPGATSKTITVGAGSGNFHCTLHPTMVGAINGPVPEQPPCQPAYGYC